MAQHRQALAADLIPNMTHPALLIIDVQQGLCEGAGAAFDGAGTITRINAGRNGFQLPY